MAWTTPETAVAGDVLTAAWLNQNVRDNTDALYQTIRRLGYVTRTTDYTANTATLASAADVFSSDITWTADGVSAYLVEFYCANAYTSTTVDTYIQAVLVTGAGAAIGILADAGPSQVSGKRGYGSMFARYFYTPAAGSASINVRALSQSSGSGALQASSGGSGINDRLPMYLAVYGPAIT